MKPFSFVLQRGIVDAAPNMCSYLGIFVMVKSSFGVLLGKWFGHDMPNTTANVWDMMEQVQERKMM